MVFFEIEMLSIPQITFACSVDIEKYKNKFQGLEKRLEITVCEAGRILFEHTNGQKDISEPGMLIGVTRELSGRSSSYNNERQKHTTVGVDLLYNIKKYSSESECDLTLLKKRMKKSCIILIPFMCHPDDDLYTKVLRLIKKIIQANFFESQGNRIDALANWYSLTATLTDFVLKKLSDAKEQLPPSELIYTTKAIRYIEQNYINKISVKEISDHLGISAGYLHKIFRDVKGIGILEHINRHRISVAIDLVRNKNLSLKEAAQNVGIDDPSYMSRLFKKVTGMSFKEYFENSKT